MFLRYCILRKYFSLDFIRFTNCLLILLHPPSFPSRRPWQLRDPCQMSAFGSQLELPLALQDDSKPTRDLCQRTWDSDAHSLHHWRAESERPVKVLLCIGPKLPFHPGPDLPSPEESLIHDEVGTLKKLNEYEQCQSCVAFSGQPLNKWHNLFLNSLSPLSL